MIMIHLGFPVTMKCKLTSRNVKQNVSANNYDISPSMQIITN